jgi:hypothetical protein
MDVVAMDVVAMDVVPTTPTDVSSLFQSPVDMAVIQPYSQPEVDSTPLNTITATPTSTNQPLPQSTPVKLESSTTCPFTTHQKYRVESCTTMGEEMEKYLVGPMPIQQFLDHFFPLSRLPGLQKVPGLYKVPDFAPGCYHNTVSAKKETDSYDHFVSL